MTIRTPPVVFVISASKLPREFFQRGTFLGRSLATMPQELRPKLILRDKNYGTRTLGLSAVYNSAISHLRDKSNDTIVVFCHDDVYIHDWFFTLRLLEALSRFQIVGIVGSNYDTNEQVGWCTSLDDKGVPYFLPHNQIRPSGVINHFNPIDPIPEYLGPSSSSCLLLDGCFLATSLGTLRNSQLAFDERFLFHGYDTAFCRNAVRLGLSLGTIPLSVTHASGGQFSDSWLQEVTFLATTSK